MKLKKGIQAFLWIAFACYVFLLIAVMFLGGRSHRFQGETFWDYISRSVNLIPFRTISEYILRGYHTLAVRNIGGNLLLFMPMGFFLPVLFPFMQKLWKTVLSVCGIVLLAECLQLLLRRGIFDIDDLLLNATGAVFGYLVYKIFAKIYCKISAFRGIL